MGALLLCGCASVPNSIFSYSLPETRVSIEVTRTVTCVGTNQIVFTDAVVPSVTQVRGNPKSFDTSILNGELADTQVTIDYHANGTLKGINAENTGAGKAIISAAIKFADMFVETTKMSGGDQPSPAQVAELCQLVSGLKDKALTLRFEGRASLADNGVVMLQPSASSSSIVAQFPRAIPKLCVHAKHSSVPAAPFAIAQGKPPPNTIPLREPGLANLEVLAVWSTNERAAPAICPLAGLPIWEGAVIATQAGTDYGLPVPALPAFGKTAFSFTLSDSGALQKVTFGKTNGIADAFDGATEALDAAQGSSTAEETKAINEEIELIKAQRKLELCQQDPTQCD